MNAAQMKKAQSLANQVAGLGLTNKKPVPIRFSYKEAPAPSDFSLQSLIIPLVKQAMAELQPKEAEVTPEQVKKIIQIMHSLPEMDKLEVSKGIRNASSFIYGGTKYGTHELMHGGASAAAASSISVITVTGTIDDSNKTFTAVTQPTLLNINGGFYNTTGGTYTWSYLAGVITLNFAVGTGGSIFGI